MMLNKWTLLNKILILGSTILSVQSAPATTEPLSGAQLVEFMSSIGHLPGQKPLVTSDPYLDYLKSDLDGSISYLAELNSTLAILKSARAQTQATGVISTDSNISLATTTAMSQQIVRNIGFAIASTSANDPHANDLSVMLALATQMQSTSAAEVVHPNNAAAEDARLAAYQAFDEKMLAVNQSGLAQKQQQVASLQETDSKFSSSAHTPIEKAEKLLSDYSLLLDQVTKWKNDETALSTTDRLAIELYTDGVYIGLNEALWKRETLTADLALFESTLQSAIKKLPVYSGTVYRKTHLNASQLERYQIGAVITNHGYTSTSIDDGFSSSATVHLIMSSKSGRKIANFSYHYVENEVVFLPETQFTVTALSTRADGSTEIEMQEK